MISNCNNQEIVASVFALFSSGGETTISLRNERLWFGTKTNSRLLISVEAFIWRELSLVQEVEQVFVDRNDKDFHVISVINERNPDVRAKIYKREQAVMDEYPNLDFDFRVVTRMNRSLTDVVTHVGGAYRR